jgi:hypothetical protein
MTHDEFRHICHEASDYILSRREHMPDFESLR